MRFVAAVAFAALALAACNQNPSQTATTAPAAPAASNGVFPDLLAASYRSEAVISIGSHTIPVVIYHDGHKRRMEMDTPQGHQVMIQDPSNNTNIMIMDREGQQMAINMPGLAMQDVPADWQNQVASESHRTGGCSAGGENGSQWEHQDEGGANPRTVCVTDDGILLRATNNGATTWETTSVQRGPQAAALFRAPPGMYVQDGSAMAARMAEAMAKMRAGQTK